MYMYTQTHRLFSPPHEASKAERIPSNMMKAPQPYWTLIKTQKAFSSVAHNKVQDVIVGEVSWSSRKTSTARKRMLSTVRRLADPGEHRVRKPAPRAGGKRTHDQSP